MVTSVNNDNVFLKHLKIAKKEGRYVLAKFSANWCGPCKAIQPLYNSLAKKTKNVNCLLLNINSCPKSTLNYKIKSLPSFIVIKDGKLKGTLAGANKEGLKNMFRQCSQGKL